MLALLTQQLRVWVSSDITKLCPSTCFVQTPQKKITLFEQVYSALTKLVFSKQDAKTACQPFFSRPTWFYLPQKHKHGLQEDFYHSRLSGHIRLPTVSQYRIMCRKSASTVREKLSFSSYLYATWVGIFFKFGAQFMKNVLFGKKITK